MADYEDGGYYEIQLNNKQLFFFFMAALAIAVVVFLCGVMVGRGVRDQAIAAAGASFIGETEASGPGGSVTPAEIRRELDYPERLESGEVEERLAGSSPEKLLTAAAKPEPPAAVATKPEEPAKTPAVTVPRAKPESPGEEPPSLGAEQGKFTVQIVALKTREAAEALVTELEERGYRTYIESGGEGGLYRVRVGWFASRAEAEKVATDLRSLEKFKPYITTQ